MRIATWNVNGMRAAVRKGIDAKLAEIDADVWLFQEVRATPEQLPEEWRNTPMGYEACWNPAQKLGYAGTAVWSRAPMKAKPDGVGGRDTDGRVTVARVGPVRAVSVYLPSGSSGPHRQAIKDKWLRFFPEWAGALLRSRIPTVLGGDFNIAHTERDIFYAKGNQKNSGFLPHERAWMGAMLDAGWRDLVREAAGDVDGPYSWWSNRGQARKLDRGWRIDYLLANKAFHTRVTGAKINRDASLGVSDHAPVIVEADFDAG